MSLPILTDGLVLPVSHALIQILTDELTRHAPGLDPVQEASAITFNFRDPDYSVERGGYHPVEIRLSRSDNGFRFDYLTDFSYVGAGWDIELAKEIDFDINADCCEVRFCRPVPLRAAVDFFSTFQDNFVTYYQLGVFTIEVSVEKADG